MPEPPPESGEKTLASSQKTDNKKRTWSQRLRRSLFLYVVVPYLVLVILLTVFQRKLIYHPSKTTNLSLPTLTLSKGIVENIAVPTEDGLTIKGWHYHPTTSKTDQELLHKEHWLVLFFPGNAADRSRRIQLPQHLLDVNIQTIICDYRGYADNPGSPNEAVLLADAEALWKFAINKKGATPQRIIIYGESLGGGVATHLAAYACKNNQPPAGLVLSGTFSSLADAAASKFPMFPVRWMLLDQFNSAEIIPTVTCPIIQIHGTQDQIVPITIGKKLFAVIPNQSKSGVEKKFVELTFSGHNNIPVSDILTAIHTIVKVGDD